MIWIAHLRRFGACLIVLSALCCGTQIASAQDSGTVHMVVGFAPGGTNDLFARVLAEKLHGILGRPVIVDNRPGAAGMLAVRSVMTAKPDGNTLMVGAASSEIQAARQDAPFDILTDLTQVILNYTGAHTLYVNSALPIHNFADLVAYDHAHPGTLSYGSFGVGSQLQLAFELLNTRMDLHLVHVPYRSNSETLMAVTKNEVQVSLEPYATLKQRVATGEVRPIAVTSLGRDPNAPDLPSLNEAGVTGFNIVYWSGMHLPPHAPPAIVASYNKAFNEILRDPEVVAVMDRLGVQAKGGTPEDFQNFLATDLVPIKELIRKLNIRFE